MTEKVQDNYEKLSDVEHVLLRPGMYIGSITSDDEMRYVFNEDIKKFEKRMIKYNPGFLKLFDEIISNSVDESKRKGSKLTSINVVIDKENGFISVEDNGGIPVEIHKKTGLYIPTLCFSEMRAGSNFKKDEDRTGVVGTNGLGSVAANIFSQKFVVDTCDGKKSFHQDFLNNMSVKHEPIITSSRKHGTTITYYPDFERFGMTSLDDDMFKCIEYRVYEVAGTNPKLNITFNGHKIEIKSFLEFCKMFTDEEIIYEENVNWQVGVAPCKDGFNQISYAWDTATWGGGTHVDYIINQFMPTIREYVKKKTKSDISPAQVKNHMIIFINASVNNVQFSSQTKERLTTDPKKFDTSIELSKKFITSITKSEIVSLITDWLDTKKQADEKAAIRDANRQVSKLKIEKLVDCKYAGTAKKNETMLFITEGDSAASGYRKYRNPNTQALFPVLGKILNVQIANKTSIRANKEIIGIMSAMGLKFGESPFEYANSEKVKINLSDGELICDLEDEVCIDGKFITVKELIGERKMKRVDLF